MVKRSDDYETVDEVALDALPSSRWYTPSEAWEAYERLTNRLGVLALFGAWNAAVKRLLKSGKAKLGNGQIRKVG